MLPLTSRHATLGGRGRHALTYVAAVAGVVALAAGFLGLVAGPVLGGVFGATYAADRDVLRVLALAAIPGAVAIGLAPLLAIHARRALIWLVGAALATNLALNLVLVPTHREMGAAWASVISVSMVAAGATVITLRWPDTEVIDVREAG